MIFVWGVTDKGAVRIQNQDSYYLKPLGENLALAIVCDGMGGARAGNVASALAIETASAYFETLSDDELLNATQEHLVRAAKLANKAVYRKSGQDVDCQGMGTTMVAAVVSAGKASILNIGDSRAYHIGGEGIAKVSRDHSVVEDMIYRGELTPEEARLHPQKNLITRCLGVEPEVKPDLYEIALKPGDFLLLCTDGLSNTLTDQELLYEALYGGSGESCCKRMLDVALSKGATDNVTAVLFQIV